MGHYGEEQCVSYSGRIPGALYFEHQPCFGRKFQSNNCFCFTLYLRSYLISLVVLNKTKAFKISLCPARPAETPDKQSDFL